MCTWTSALVHSFHVFGFVFEHSFQIFVRSVFDVFHFFFFNKKISPTIRVFDHDKAYDLKQNNPETDALISAYSDSFRCLIF